MTAQNNNIKNTDYGFVWGKVLVERTAEIKKHKILSICTERDRVDLRITPTGLIRITKIK